MNFDEWLKIGVMARHPDWFGSYILSEREPYVPVRPPPMATVQVQMDFKSAASGESDDDIPF